MADHCSGLDPKKIAQMQAKYRAQMTQGASQVPPGWVTQELCPIHDRTIPCHSCDELTRRAVKALETKPFPAIRWESEVQSQPHDDFQAARLRGECILQPYPPMKLDDSLFLQSATADQATPKEPAMDNYAKVSDAINPAAETLTASIGDALARGAKIGASRIAVRKLVELARKTLGPSYPAFLDTPVGRQLEQAIICGVVLLVAQSWKSMPKRELVTNIALIGVEAQGAELVALAEQSVAPLVEMFIAQLAEDDTAKLLDV